MLRHLGILKICQLRKRLDLLNGSDPKILRRFFKLGLQKFEAPVDIAWTLVEESDVMSFH